MPDKIFQQASDGTLASAASGNGLAGWVRFDNRTPLPLGAYLLSDTSVRLGIAPGNAKERALGVGYPAIPIPPMSKTEFKVGPIIDGWCFVIVNTCTGALVDVQQAVIKQEGADWVAIITPKHFRRPNAIGKWPEPNKDIVIPPDSPRITVGCGQIQHNENIIALEQYWRRLPQSYSLGPGETRVVSHTSTSGLDTTTSNMTQVAASVGVSASGGWGPVSASVSASLNMSSSATQQVNVKSQTTSFISETFTNKTETSKLVFVWELTSMATIFTKQGAPLASIVYRQEDPAIIAGPYSMDTLPLRPGRTEPMTQHMREILAGEKSLQG
ncbi:hypothetical protein ACFV0Z_15090 [Streptomyces xiamenensis]|uniref:hypothetical protein n=1 Tax=Streptomyces xiamenensis TaxID=408015 RepID=UPI0036995F0D